MSDIVNPGFPLNFRFYSVSEVGAKKLLGVPLRCRRCVKVKGVGCLGINRYACLWVTRKGENYPLLERGDIRGHPIFLITLGVKGGGEEIGGPSRGGGTVLSHREEDTRELPGGARVRHP